MKKSIILLVLLSVPAAVLVAVDREAEFKNMIRNVYNFSPSKASEETRKSKSADMDKLWALVESDKTYYLPLLRRELQAPGADRFFCYDGSILLLKNSPVKKDMELAVGAIARSDLEDIQHFYYFQTVHGLACEGVDAYPAVENMLNTPGLRVFVADHFLTLGQDYSVLYCLLCMDEGLYLDRLVRRLKAEKNPETAKTIILSIAYTVTDKGQKAIREYADSCTNPELKKHAVGYTSLESKEKLPKKEVKAQRKFFQKFLNDFVNREYGSKEYDFKEYAADAYYLVKKEDYAKIKALRKAQARRVSDEALGEIDFLTMLLQYSFTSGD